jgi:hypothetical protein
VIRFSENMMNHLDPLRAYLKEEGKYDFGPAFATEEDDVQKDFRAWSNDRGYKRVRWKREFYQNTFDALDLKVVTLREDPSGPPVRWIQGLKLFDVTL